MPTIPSFNELSSQQSGDRGGKQALANGLPETIATAGAVTYTADAIMRGTILRDPAGAGRADLFPTATALLAAMIAPSKGSSIDFVIRNTADANETITLTTNTGITLSGTMTVAQNNTKIFRAVVTDVTTPAVTVYSIMTGVH